MVCKIVYNVLYIYSLEIENNFKHEDRFELIEELH